MEMHTELNWLAQAALRAILGAAQIGAHMGTRCCVAFLYRLPFGCCRYEWPCRACSRLGKRQLRAARMPQMTNTHTHTEHSEIA